MTDERSLDGAMDRYAQGEQAAFLTVYTGLELRLRSFLIRLAGSASIGEELLQETFMRVHRARGAFEPGGAVVPWAYAIARNVWIDHMRSANTRSRSRANAEVREPQTPQAEGSTGPDADPEQVAMARETASMIEGVLGRLPPAQREAFVLLRYERMSIAEAAEILGSTPTAVKLRAFRAYEALRRALDLRATAEGEDDGI